jgi:hypothetical protein
VAGESLGAGPGAERRQLFRIARSERHPQTLSGQEARQGRAQPASGAEEQRSFMAGLGMFEFLADLSKGYPVRA